jgi:type VI secretion system ImpC/EvpB family protein
MKVDLLSQAIAATNAAEGVGSQLDRFLRAPTLRQSLEVWLEGQEGLEPDSVRVVISREIAYIDELLCEQTNAILHHPKVQALEASWRGLRLLCDEAIEADNVKIRFLDLSWKELVKDQERAIEFDQSQLFRLVYTAEFDMPGGEPYGALLGDYYLTHRPSAAHPTDDLGALGGVLQVAAASFSPFLASVEPSFFGLDSLRELERPDLSRIFQDKHEYTKWNSLRDRFDSRFVGLLLPRVLMRTPYSDYVGRADGFRFIEDVSEPDRYLWGNPTYAFGCVLMRAYTESGWFGSVRGVYRDTDWGGLVTGLPTEEFSTDSRGLLYKPSTESMISDALERNLADHGFIPLCHCHGADYATFYSTQSIHRAKKYDDASATTNAKISAMLNYMFCVSRFAHYVKVIGRDCVGSFATADECQRFIRKWLMSFTSANEDASEEMKARYPLREANVEVKDVPGKPGVYASVIHLKPHYQLDQMAASVTLVTQVYTGAH